MKYWVILSTLIALGSAVPTKTSPLIKAGQDCGNGFTCADNETCCPTGCCSQANWFCCPDNKYCAATEANCPLLNQALKLAGLAAKKLKTSEDCEDGSTCPTCCTAGCCPEVNWFCCPDNMYCAATEANCPLLNQALKLA